MTDPRTPNPNSLGTPDHPFNITEHPLEHYWTDRKGEPMTAGDEVERGEPDRPVVEPLTGMKSAKGRLMFAWFAAHENQPMPEGRAIVERLFAEIEAAARETAQWERELEAEHLRRAATPAPALREAAKYMAGALSLHNKTPDGNVKPCLPGCVGCESLDIYRAALAASAPVADPTPLPTKCALCGEPHLSATSHDHIALQRYEFEHPVRLASAPVAEGLDAERLARVRHSLVDDIGTALSAALAQGNPFEPYDRIYVAKTITRVLDDARSRIDVAAGPEYARLASEVERGQGGAS